MASVTLPPNTATKIADEGGFPTGCIIANISAETVYLNFTDQVTASAGPDAGIPMAPGEEKFFIGSDNSSADWELFGVHTGAASAELRVIKFFRG